MNINNRTYTFAALIAAALMLAPAAGLADEATTKVGYKKGFFIQDGDDFLLRTSARIQSRLTYEKPDEGDDELFFNLPRVRLAFSGHAFNKDWTYKFQTDFGKGQASLKDFYVDYAASKGVFHVRVGQQKRPFSRQLINSSSKLVLVDRALTTKAFGLGRDIGIVLHNNMTKSPTFAWSLGILNGASVKSRTEAKINSGETADPNATPIDLSGIKSTGKMTNSIDHFEPAIVARVGYNHGKLKGYSEADLEGGSLRFGIAAGAYATLDLDDSKDAFTKATVDTMLKVSGFALSGAFYLQMDQNGEAFSDQKMGLMGAFAQASYAINGKYVPAARFTWLNDDDADKTTMEIAGGFSTMLFKHKVKWQTDVAMVTTKVGDASSNDIVARSQLQFNF